MTTSTTPIADDLLRALVVPLRVATSAGELNLLSTIATFGTALDITVADLSIESFFPADGVTRSRLEASTLT